MCYLTKIMSCHFARWTQEFKLKDAGVISQEKQSNRIPGLNLNRHLEQGLRLA
jgi:hypothetical protein